MRIASIVSLICVAGALAGCAERRGIAFVASNPDSVLLDISGNPPDELAAANDAATQQCQVYSSRSAVLESLNVRERGTFRATYLCRGGIRSADASMRMRHRK